MPAVAGTKSVKLRAYATEFSCLAVHGNDLLCTLCACKLSFDQRSQVLQHMKTAKHQKNVQLKAKKQTQMVVNKKSRAELWCEALIKSGIPFNVLDNQPFRDFIESEVRYVLPSESSVRKQYLSIVTEKHKAEMIKQLNGKDLYLIFDEMSFKNRAILAIMIGDCSSPKAPYLVQLTELEKTNSETVAKSISSALFRLFENVTLRVLISDGAPCCMKAGRALKGLFDGLIHIRCHAHASHLAFEQVRAKNDGIDKAIASLKQVLAKSSCRRQTFPVALPPWPVITRWGTWVSCAIYMGKHFGAISCWVRGLEDDGVLVENVKRAFTDPNLQENLASLLPLEAALAAQTTLLENCSLLEAIQNAENFCNSLGNFPYAQRKFMDVRDGPNGLQHVADKTCELMFCPITSVEVERLFSKLKRYFTEKPNILIENLEIYLFLNTFPV